MRYSKPWAVACILLGLPAALPARQVTRVPRTHALELTFSAGYFQPSGPSGAVGSVILNRRGSWEAGVHFAGYAKSGRLGAEISAGYAPERVRLGGDGFGSRRTHLTFGTAKLLVGRSPRKPGISVMGGAGVAVMHRQKSITDSDVGSSAVGGVASLLVRIPIDDQVGLRLDGEDLISHEDWGNGGKLRNDFVLTAGLGISW